MRNTDPFSFSDMGHVVTANEPDVHMCVVVPAYLPDGATIGAFTGFVRDNDPSNGIAVGLLRRDFRTFPTTPSRSFKCRANPSRLRPES
jgi:hypothetical protein